MGGFSLAKLAEDPTQTAAGVLRGSPTYMPPERWRGVREVTAAGDLFSLGVLLWELAAGGRFFPKLGLGAMFDLIERRSPDEEAAVVEAVFPELAPIVRGLLQRDPAARTASAEEVGAQLEALRARIEGEGSLEQFVWMLGTLDEGEADRAPGDGDSLHGAWDRLVRSAEESLAGDEFNDGMPTSPGMTAVMLPRGSGAAAASLSGPFWDDREWGRGDWRDWAPERWTQSAPQLLAAPEPEAVVASEPRVAPPRRRKRRPVAGAGPAGAPAPRKDRVSRWVVAVGMALLLGAAVILARVLR